MYVCMYVCVYVCVCVRACVSARAYMDVFAVRGSEPPIGYTFTPV